MPFSHPPAGAPRPRSAHTPPDRIRLLVADPHPVARIGVRAVARACPEVEVVGEAADPRQAGGVAFDVAVVDVPPGEAGASAVAAVRAGPPPRAVVVLSACEEPAAVRRVLSAGASGYVLKRSSADELVRAVRAVAAGGTYLDPAVAVTVLGSGPAGAELSEREAAVVRQIARGYSNKEIAAQLKLSVKTVETYKARSMEKLGLYSRVDLVRYAVQQGWLAGE